MNKIIKSLKIVLLLVAIVVGVALIIGLVFVYKGIKSGDLNAYATKTAIENFAPNNLSETQKQLLESGDFEGLYTELEQNITPDQIDCAIEALGRDRAEELLITKDPTPQEILKLSKCL